MQKKNLKHDKTKTLIYSFDASDNRKHFCPNYNLILSGKVNDGTNAIIDADVTLTHLPTNSVYRAKTDKQGRYSSKI